MLYMSNLKKISYSHNNCSWRLLVLVRGLYLVKEHLRCFLPVNWPLDWPLTLEQWVDRVLVTTS